MQIFKQNFNLGFSLGGLLALSVTASLWKEGLIGVEILEKNLCCICQSPVLINIPVLQEVSIETPQIKSTLHSILVNDDIIPRLSIFLDSGNENFALGSSINFESQDPFYCIEVIITVTQLVTINSFLFSF